MYGKGIKRRLLVSSPDCKSSDMCSVWVWELLGANRCENSTRFSANLRAIDLHEGSSFIPQGIFTNSTTRPCIFVLYYMESRFMGSSYIKKAYFVDLGRSFYQGERLMLRWPKIGTKMDELVGFGQQAAVQTSFKALQSSIDSI